MSHGYGEARPIGRMVPLQAPQERLPDAWCDHADCGCKLSRYRDAHERYCLTHKRLRGIKDAPPDPAGTSSAEQARKAVTKPRSPKQRVLTEDEKRDNPHYQLCACGRGYHRRERERCRQCAADKRRTGRGTWRRVCDCGRRKASGALRCRACAYPDSYLLRGAT